MDKIKFINGETPLNDENLNKMQDNIERAIAVGGVAGDTLPIGAVVEFPSDTSVPENWLLCNGQEVSRTEYDLLFAVIGTTWGAGDGSTTFNVPTKEGLVTVGKKASDADFNTLGKTGGEKEVTLTIDKIPSHSHRVVTTTGNQDTSIALYPLTRVESLSDNTDSSAILPTGGGQPHNNLQPYVTSNFIIKAKQSAGVVADVVDSLESDSDTDALSAKQGKVLNDKIAKIVSKSVSGNEMCTKFDDGTMIVTGTSDTVSFTGTGNTAKTIDISKYGFISLLSAVGTAQVSYADTNYCDFVVYVHSKSKDKVNYQIWNKYPSNIGIHIDYIIVGVWK